MQRNKTKTIVLAGSAALALLLILLGIFLAKQYDHKPTTYAEIISQAQKYMANGDYDNALLAFQKAMDLDMTRADAYLGMVAVYNRQGQKDLAVSVLRQGISNGASSLEIDELLNDLINPTPPTPLPTGTPIPGPLPEPVSTQPPEPTPTNELIETRSLSGAVYDERGQQVDGVSISFYTGDGTEVYSTLSDYNGIYSADIEESGSYTAVLSKDGFIDKNVSVFISGSTIDLHQDFTLTHEGTTEDDFDNRQSDTNAMSGEITLSLIWDTYDDLDLHCHTPNGSEIYYFNRNADGGTLDVDAQFQVFMEQPIENIYFSQPQHGNYRVDVHNLSSNGTSARVRVQIGGTVEYYNITIGGRDSVTVASFTY